jgi:hypothetical protein
MHKKLKYDEPHHETIAEALAMEVKANTVPDNIHLKNGFLLI